MTKYYDDSEFDDLRHRLWSRSVGDRSSGNQLSRPEIRLLNFFEALGIAVQQGVLDAHLVGRMLGAPLRQLAENPFLGPYAGSPKNSYEGIRELWTKLGFKPPAI